MLEENTPHRIYSIMWQDYTHARTPYHVLWETSGQTLLVHCEQGGNADASTSGRGFESWGPGLRERLSDIPRMIDAQHGSASAVAAADVDGPVLYSVGSAGTLKILSLSTGAQVMSL
jgi:hypothetical protein